MLSFDYARDLQLEDSLGSIDRLRTHILTVPLSPAAELKLQWEGTAIRTWATLALSGLNAPKHHIATILAHPGKPTAASARIYALRDAFEYIHADWRAQDKSITLRALETVSHMIMPKSDTPFSAIEQSLRELLTYLAAETAHPVIQASIAHIHILTLQDGTDIGIFARLVHYLILARYGYDIRGYATPERVWQEDESVYRKLFTRFPVDRHMNTWMSFMVQSMRRSLELLSADLESKRFHIEFPRAYWSLTDRQKEIMKSMQSLGATVTNKAVQKIFRVSQITASRDLAGLARLGLLFPHGKGRSVYYTRI